MRYFVVAIVLFFINALSHASVSDCIDSAEGNQLALNACASEDYERADKQLNQTWKELIKQLSESESKKMRVAQRAWIAFRDAEVEAAFPCEDQDPTRCWGQTYFLFTNELLSDLTRQRTKQLQVHIENSSR